MKLFYSATTNGFYSSVIHGNNLPEDAVAITELKHKQLMQAQALGKQITADSSGRPKAVARVMTAEAKWRVYQSEAQNLLDQSDRIVWRSYEAKIDVPVEWVQYREALRMIMRTEGGGDTSLALPVAPPKPNY